jgi:dihydroorotate dehydrogenase
MYRLFRPLLFSIKPETAHALTLYALRTAQYFPITLSLLKTIYKTPAKPVTAFGLTFKNPVGLAAGYDKDAVAVKGLGALGFGHIEIGSVTPMPQGGNPKPRVFRLVEDEAIINRMGFPSHGSGYVRKQLNPVRKMSAFELVLGRRPIKSDVVLGINLGKNKSTPNEEAVIDYLSLLEDFAPHAEYLTINVSSPNTVGLRALQGRAALEELLSQLHAQRQMEEAKLDKKLPLLVKLAPDLSESELDEALGVILQTHMDGVIATNTTLARDGLRSKRQGESGGLSGGPLTGRSEAILRQVVERVSGKIPIVSVGGIMSPADAKRRLDMGAALVQVYTGLVYRGPGLVKQIVHGLSSS